MTAALPAGRREQRIRLYVRGEWETPVYDSATSDMHPDDYLLYGPHTELSVVIDLPGIPGQPGTQFRWSGVWSQVSRRKIERRQMSEYLQHLLVMPNPFLPPIVGGSTSAWYRKARQLCGDQHEDGPAGCPTCRMYEARLTPITEIARDVLVDADLTLQYRRSIGR
ncbi:hypothetical protein [Mycobacterium sp. PSTR-4-N]|uniref:hypothetical protein n=1 Tax=Mycobacterium sp. PSTR-4-N TaxID=2917745 RepID=UPI001F149FC5|nr:hypothetical protein [Mycobacterium sp. PSTR-4-N]MCG7592412.1 hypothetical protein [Mycobacterium sp. PSTR-4-N]